MVCRLVSENQKAIRDFVRSVRVGMDERDTALVAEQNATLLVRPHRRRILTYRRLSCGRALSRVHGDVISCNRRPAMSMVAPTET